MRYDVLMSKDLSDRLRRHGLHVTAQRLAVLRAVSEHPHITAEAVFDLAQAELGAISRQAIYDALNTLADKNLIRRIQPMGSPTRYEARGGQPSSPHLPHLRSRGRRRLCDWRGALPYAFRCDGL